MTRGYAYSENRDGQKHDLVEHLKAVARLAAQFAGKFGAADFGYWAGLWHDLGKFHPDFQSYIAAPEGRRGPDHSSAGTIHASICLDALAFVVAGHHAGLPGRTDLKNRIKGKEGFPHEAKALELARAELSTIVPKEPLDHKLPDFLIERASKSPNQGQLQQALELFIRMLFSALVDADFLDTEAHFDNKRSNKRAVAPALRELWNRFEEDQVAISGVKGDRLNQVRHEIYQACVAAADSPPGIFSLTVPTGGGENPIWNGLCPTACAAPQPRSRDRGDPLHEHYRADS